MSDPDTQSVMAPPLGLTARGVWMMTGLVWFLFSLSCITVGLLYSDSCPRHPTLAIWLVVMGVILTLLSLSLSLLNLPAFYTKARVTARPPAEVKISACTVFLLFLTCLLSILILLTLISWLSLGTFWLFHSGPRLPGEYESECSSVLLVMVGITVVLSWVGLLTALLSLTWTSCRHCHWGRATYFPVRVRQTHPGYLRLKKTGVLSNNVNIETNCRDK